MHIWTRKNLTDYLFKNHVDITKWGKGSAKTIEHLLQELIKGECEMFLKDNKVYRKVEALSINVWYKDEKLEEEYQRFKDGRIRRRKMDCSVAEKLTRDEGTDLVKAVKRGLAEELRLTTIKSDQIEKGPIIDRVRASDSYPGTMMEMVLYKFEVHLTYEQYHPYGYIEHQDDKDTYFVWIKNKVDSETY